jgi:excisionase family DNA binding protein
VEPQLLTVEEVISRLAVSRATLYRLVRAGELRALKIGRVTRFRASDVQAFIERRVEAGLYPVSETKRVAEPAKPGGER